MRKALIRANGAVSAIAGGNTRFVANYSSAQGELRCVSQEFGDVMHRVDDAISDARGALYSIAEKAIADGIVTEDEVESLLEEW